MAQSCLHGVNAESPRARLSRLLERTSHRLATLLALFGGLAAFLLFLVVCVNAASRLVDMPLRGAVESSGVFCALCAALALGYAQVHGNHITGGVAVGRLPRPMRILLQACSQAAGAVFFCFCSYEIWDLACFALECGETIDGLGNAYPYLVMACVPGFVCEALILALSFVSTLVSGEDA